MDLVPVAETPARLVDDQRVILPGIPVAEHDFDEFIGAIIPRVMRHHLGMAHIRRLAVVQGGDEVPRCPPLAHQIEGLEDAGHMERLEIGGGRGGTQAKPLGHRPHHGQHDDRVHLHAADAVFDRMDMVGAEAVGHRQPVVEEAEIEFSGFQDTGDFLEIIS